ncbi:MAG: hypothetical protein Q4A78_04150 [Peptostreptococcaceae bacterium]|nr:hypothetical protein [Peptostreptococcaceae bacterium]
MENTKNLEKMIRDVFPGIAYLQLMKSSFRKSRCPFFKISYVLLAAVLILRVIVGLTGGKKALRRAES